MATLSVADIQFLIETSPHLDADTLFGVDGDNQDHERARARRAIDGLIDVWHDLTATEEDADEAFVGEVTALGFQGNQARELCSWVRDNFQLHAEGVAIRKVPDGKLPAMCDAVFKHWAVIQDQPELVAALQSLGCTSVTLALDVRSLMERVWRWHIWLRQRTKTVRHFLGVPWTEVEGRIETIEHFGQEHRMELLLFFLARTVEDVWDNTRSSREAESTDGRAGG